MITTVCKLSYSSRTVPPIVQAVQGDTGRTVRFDVTDFTIPAGAEATYFIEKPSGEAVYNAATISGNSILCELTAQSLAEPGENKMQVRVILNDEIVTSFKVCLLVSTFWGIDAIESSTEMNIFDQAVEQATEQFQENAEQIVEEVIESIPADYTALTEEVDELNERLSDDITDVKQELDDIYQTAILSNVGVGRKTIYFPVSIGDVIKVSNNTSKAIPVSFRDSESGTDLFSRDVTGNSVREFTADSDALYVSIYFNAGGNVKIDNLSANYVGMIRNNDKSIIDIKYSLNSQVDLSSISWSVGAFNATGNEVDSTTRIRSDFVPVSEGSIIKVSAPANCLNGVYYDQDKAFVSNLPSWTSETTVPSGVSYLRFLVRASTSNPTITDADIPTIVSRCSVTLKLPISAYAYNPEYVQAKLDNLVFKKSYTANSVGRINLVFPAFSGETIKVTNDTSSPLAVAFVNENGIQSSDYSVVANSVRYFVLDYNITAIKPYFNGTGFAGFENYSKRIPKLEMGFFTSSAYNTGLSLESKLEDYAELFVNDSAEVDSYLFFTDPHIFQHLVDEDKMQLAVGTIEHTFNNSSASFVLDGGDWLQENDTEAEACYKLGRINGIMRAKFGEKYYRLLGNHDLNEQGSEELDQTAINALCFSDYGKAYYDFKTPNTRYYAFDSGSVMADSMNAYRWEQVDWFANKLIENDDKHSVIAVHMFEFKYGGEDNPTVHPFADNLTKIAQAYNTRTSITLNDVTYNFASATGKVAYMIAGHTHYDKITTQNSIPVFITLNASYTPSFDLIYVDYDNQLLSSVRVGSGSDRTMSIVS